MSGGAAPLAVSPGQGFLLIRPTDGPSVVVSTLNFIPGQTVANGAMIPLGTGGSATFLAGVTPTELIIGLRRADLEPRAESTAPWVGFLTGVSNLL